MDTPSDFAARAYAFLVICQEKGWIEHPELVDNLLNQAPPEVFVRGWAHLGQVLRSHQS